ncbi:MAG: hypothetical protein ABSE90_03370 [Verrucomicrobiota bacterium]
MRKLSPIAALILFAAILPLSARAQGQPTWEAWSLNQIIPGAPTNSSVYSVGNMYIGTNGICVRYTDEHGDTVLMADNASANRDTGDAVADGHVRIEMGEQIWLGGHINYNFKTRRMRSEQFRTGNNSARASRRCSPPGRICRATSATRSIPRNTFMSRRTT